MGKTISSQCENINNNQSLFSPRDLNNSQLVVSFLIQGIVWKNPYKSLTCSYVSPSFNTHLSLQGVTHLKAKHFSTKLSGLGLYPSYGDPLTRFFSQETVEAKSQGVHYQTTSSTLLLTSVSNVRSNMGQNHWGCCLRVIPGNVLGEPQLGWGPLSVHHATWPQFLTSLKCVQP